MTSRNDHTDHEEDVRTALKAVPISDLVAQFSRDDLDYADRVRRSLDESAPILAELAEIGYKLDTLGQLRQQGKSWRSALPVLLKWLPLVDDNGVKEELVRGLSVPWVGTHATKVLIELLKKAPPRSSLGWAVGNALSIVDVTGFEDEIIELCRDGSYGPARQMLVSSLARFDDSKAEDAALELLDDEDVKLHAIIALGKMRSKRALTRFQALSSDKRAVVRKEVRKAVQKINGA